MTPDIETLIDDLTRLKQLLPLLSRLTVRDIIEAGDEAIEAAGLNPWCINEGLAMGHERIYIDVSPAQVEAAITALRALQWRPISEAPKDGTRVLLLVYDEPFVGYWSTNQSAWFESIEWTRVYGDGRFESDGPEPTHWMPLPAARASKEG